MVEIICLANSRRQGGRCVAGKELLAGGRIGNWIRPVLSHEDAVIPDSLASKFHLLDIISMTAGEPSPKDHHTENYLVGRDWGEVDELDSSRLPDLRDTPPVLWHNGNSSTYGINDVVPYNIAKKFDFSLCLIRPENLEFYVADEWGKWKVRACFNFNGVEYKIGVTDPLMNHQPWTIQNPWLCVSLPEPIRKGRQGQWKSYKLVAAVIEQ